MPNHWPYTCPWCLKPIEAPIEGETNPHRLFSGPHDFHNDWRGGWRSGECGIMLAAHVAVNKATYEGATGYLTLTCPAWAQPQEEMEGATP